jgi:hypothetical protein
MPPARVVLFTLALSVAAFVAWMIALFMGLSATSTTAVVVLRTLFSLVALFLVTRVFVRRAYDAPGLTAAVIVAGVASYALSPAAWAGRALVGQIALEPGLLTTAIDLVVWVLAVWGASRTVSPKPSQETIAPYVARSA